MNKTFAIIGCGRIAQRHAEQIAVYGQLIAVCDIIKEKADNLASLYCAIAFYDIDELLRSIRPDAVVVCTPNGLHASHTIKILEAGMHVLCEKPMAIRSGDCREMIAASERSGKHLLIVKQNRFNPPVQALKKLIDEGHLGAIYSLQLSCFWNRDASYYHDSWKGSKELDGGTLFTQFSHFIDLLYWLAGDVKRANAFIANYAHQGIIDFEDSGVVILEFKNGITGTLNYTVNSHQKNMEGSLTVFAEHGTIKIGGQYLNTIEYQNIRNYTIVDLRAGNGANQYGTYHGSMSNHDKVYDNLINFLDGSEPAYINAYEAMKTVEIIELIQQSSINVSPAKGDSVEN